MSSSRGRASRSKSGTWRREPARAEKDERVISEEETMVRPASPVVAKLPRGRRSKAEPSPAHTVVADGFDDKLRKKPQGAAARKAVKPNRHVSQMDDIVPVSVVLVFWISCVIMSFLYGKSLSHGTETHKSGFIEMYGLTDWLDNHYMRWASPRSKAEKVIETIASIPPVADEEPLWKNSDFACPQCAACNDSITYATTEGGGTEIVRDPFPSVLAPVVNKFPAISNIVRGSIGLAHNVINNHPWASFLWIVCGAWKAAELLLPLVRMSWGYALECAESVAKTIREDESEAKKDVDEESERARREAEQKLLWRMRVIQKENEKEKEDFNSKIEGTLG